MFPNANGYLFEVTLNKGNGALGKHTLIHTYRRGTSLLIRAGTVSIHIYMYTV